MNEPLAFFITWTVYGTHLPGDKRGWQKRGRGTRESRPGLVEWSNQRLKHAVSLLSHEQRNVVESACSAHCEHREWKNWAVNARSNHCHILVTAVGYSGAIVRDQLKANCTRAVRERWPEYVDRPLWTKGGDWRCLDTEDDLDVVFRYIRDAQDRKDRDL